MIYTVGEMAQKLGVPASTLRYYDKEGLLPFVERSSGGIRMFRENDFEWLQVIRCMKKAGMSIKDIRQYIELSMQGDDTIDTRLEMFRHQREVLTQQIQQLQHTLCKTVVGCTDGEHHFTLVLCPGILCSVLCPDFLCHAESRPRLGPACIKCRMGQDLCNFTPGNAVVFCCRQVIPKRGVRQSLRHQCYHCHKAAVPEGEFILSAPHLPE